MNGLEIVESLEKKLNINKNQEDFFNEIDRSIISALKQKVSESMRHDDIIEVIQQLKNEISLQLNCSPMTLDSELRRIQSLL